MPTALPVKPKYPVPQNPDRRRSPRRPHAVEASISSPTGGPAIGVTGVDLSRHGVGLSVAKPITAGTFHTLTLGLGAQRIVGEIKIISCRKQADATYRVHAQFG